MNPIMQTNQYAFSLTPEGGIKFVDHEKNNRSGHFGHAMVQCANGDVLCFYPNCNTENGGHSGRGWMDWCRSTNGGETWSEPKNFCDHSGRVYDARVIEDTIYMLMSNRGSYFLYVSQDQGETFTLRSNVPVTRSGSFYGTLGVLEDGRLIVYAYNESDEYKLEYVISMGPGGFYWGYPQYAAFEKAIRNPQRACLGGTYFMVGRSGSYTTGSMNGNFILYCSPDGKKWDEGRYLRLRNAGIGAYSNTIVVGALDPKTPDRLLIQTSHAYYLSQTNILHWWIDAYTSESMNKGGNA